MVSVSVADSLLGSLLLSVVSLCFLEGVVGGSSIVLFVSVDGIPVKIVITHSKNAHPKKLN